MNYQGKRARIIANTNDHGFDIGQEVYLTFKKDENSDEVLLTGLSINTDTPTACYLNTDQFVLIDDIPTFTKDHLIHKLQYDYDHINEDEYRIIKEFINWLT